MDTQWLNRADELLERLAVLLPPAPSAPDWTAPAFRWRKGHSGRGWLEPIVAPQSINLDDLLHIEFQRQEIERNTRQFLSGKPANNVLLWGARGSGKSSLIKALLTTYAEQDLRLVEVDKQDLLDLPDLLAPLRSRPERFIVFCDDLSFSASEIGYQALKAALDGSLTATPDNVVIYATSNRRHLLPEFHHDNQSAAVVDGELHLGEASEEKLSLSDRFGLWLAFHPFSQDQYLQLVAHWLARLGADPQAPLPERAALQWALRRGSRSGRTAWQFACDWIGRTGD